MTKKNPKKPAAKAPAKAARRTRGAAAPRQRKAEPEPKRYVRIAVKDGKATLQESDRPDRGFKAPRRTKAEPEPISPAPELAIVKRAIHEALGRDLAELLASGAVAGVSSFQPADEKAKAEHVVMRFVEHDPRQWVRVNAAGAGSATMSVEATRDQSGPATRVRPIDEALAELSSALNDMQRITEDESVALAAVLEPSPPNAGGNATSPPLPESKLASMIARAAQLVRQDTAVRTDRLSRIDLPRG